MITTLLLAALLATPPETPKKPISDVYHGVTVTEDYRWLEDWNDEAVKAWSEAQNAHARAVLDKLPGVEKTRARLTTLLSGASVSYTSIKPAGDAANPTAVFAIKHEPTKQQPILVKLPSLDEPEQARVILDPNAMDPSGHTTIDWYIPSPKGTFVAVSISTGGSESGSVHMYKVATGGETGDLLPRAQGGTAGGSLCWLGDESAVFYTRYPRDGERPAGDMDFYVQVYKHVMGTYTEADTYEIGQEFPKIAEIMLDTSPDGKQVLASVQNGDGGEFSHHLRGNDGQWVTFTHFADKVVQVIFSDDGSSLLAVSRNGAPRGSVLKASLKDPANLGVASFTPIIPQHKSWSIDTDFFAGKGIACVNGVVLVQYQAGGPNELMAHDLAGNELRRVDIGMFTTIDELAVLGKEIAVNRQTYLQPPAWSRLGVDPAHIDSAFTATKLVTSSPARLDDCSVSLTLATSKDGTQVPVYILHRKDIELNGQNPTIVWGYGGYGVCESPGFSPRRAFWLEQGGVFAVACIRGGGEFGEEWHLQGNLLNKQNVFDDYFAACSMMIEKKWTSREKLACMGGSNGGLLMGATMTQHPDLCKAVLSSVGIYDMLRVELSANGAFNVTEFGTVKDPAQFRALHAYSPLHNVNDGTRYPNVLFMTGANDPRVDPMQSRKMTARLQAASPNSQTLLRTSANSGHGIGSSLSQRIEEYTDVYAWLADQLGVTVK